MYIQPMSNSYHFDDSCAEVAKAWWLLCSSSPPIRMPHGTMLVLASVDVVAAIAEPVADAVDHAGGPERDPDDLRQQDQHAGNQAEQRDVDRAHQPQAPHRIRRDRRCARSSRRACRDRSAPSSPCWPTPSRTGTRPASSTRLMPCTCGLCGSSAVSTLAWCLRWIAAHSLVTMPVVSQSQRRKKCDTTGCRSSARCAWWRCR